MCTDEIDNISSDIKEEFKLLIDSLDKYITKRNRKNVEFDEFIRSDIDSSFAIFGCGNYGCKVYQFLRKNKCSVVCFFDNNFLLWGNYINNIPVLSPEDINKIDDSVRFVVANEKHSAGIEKQIRELSNNPDVRIIRYCEGLC